MNQRVGRAYPGTQAVLRAVALLKAFTQERPEPSLGELSRAVGLHKTTTYRLLSALESEGLVERTPARDGYRLGPAVLALGGLALGAGGLRAASRDELQVLAAETRETATLEVLVGGDVLILDETVGSHVIGAVPSVGTRWPAHATSTGKVLLAHLPEARLAALLAAPLPALTGKTLTQPPALRRELERARERGYAVAVEELEQGFVALAAPVRDAGGSVVAALSVGGPKARLNAVRVAAVARILPVSAARVSARLGFVAPAAVQGPQARERARG